MSKRIVQGRSSSSLFLVELIVAIGFFAVASAVCLQLFVRARLLSIEGSELSHATLAAQSAAEAFRTTDGSLDSVFGLLEAELRQDTVTIWYDSDWRPAAEQRAAYRLCLTADFSRQPASAEILVNRQKDSQTLYRLTVKTPGNFPSAQAAGAGRVTP